MFIYSCVYHNMYIYIYIHNSRADVRPSRVCARGPAAVRPAASGNGSPAADPRRRNLRGFQIFGFRVSAHTYMHTYLKSEI